MTNNIPFEKLKLTDPRSYYRDFKHPWAYTFAEEHRRMNWTREEVRTLHEDVADWKSMTEEERAPRQFLLNYFVQADVDGRFIFRQFRPLVSSTRATHGLGTYHGS